MASLQKDFDSLIAKWSDFVNGDAEPYRGYSTYDLDPKECKCEMHAWDALTGGNLSHHCDIFMGLYYSRDATGHDPLDVEVLIGGLPVCTLKLSPGDKILAFEGKTFISLLNVAYSSVRLRPRYLSSADDLYIVYANVSIANRAPLGLSNLYFVTPERSRGEYTSTRPVLLYHAGMGGLSQSLPPRAAIRLPEFPDALSQAAQTTRRNQAACQAQLNRYKEQLLQAAWHPRRHVQWCLDTDALKGLEELLPRCSADRRVWYDEVIIISSSTEPTMRECFEVIRHHDRSVFFCCLQSDGRTWMKIRGQAGRYLAVDPCKPYCTSREAL